MNINIDKRNNFVIITWKEDKLLSNFAPLLKAELVILASEGFKNMVLDITCVRYVDSSGISTLIVGNRLCKEASGKFIIAGVGSHIQKLITVSRLDSLLHTSLTLDDAMLAIENGKL